MRNNNKAIVIYEANAVKTIAPLTQWYYNSLESS